MRPVKFNTFASLFVMIISLTSLSTGYCQEEKGNRPRSVSNAQLVGFEAKLDSLRNTYKIPGLSVAIVQRDSIVYQRGLGYANIEAKLPATPTTTYRIASLTKPIASTILLKLEQEGRLSIQDSIKKIIPGYEDYYRKVRDYVLANEPEYASVIQDFDFERDDITIWHHLTHTAENVPGDAFKYNGFLFGALSRVMELKLGKPFHEIVEGQILEPYNMQYSASSQAQASSKTLQLLAQPYEYLVDKGKFIPSDYPDPDVNAGAGIVSNVIDLAKFDKAIDDHLLVNSETQEAAWTNQANNAGETMPYGLGWFVQHRNGERVIWHYGWQPKAFSGLYLKFPEAGLTLFLLANSENLSAPFKESGYDRDVFASPFARLFYETFLD